MIPAREPKIAVTTAVLFGEFTPTVFQPAWFARQNLLPEKEASGAKIGIVHSDITAFQTEWLQFQVGKDRFTATCLKDDAIPLLQDLLKGTFHFFPQNPVTMLDIVRSFHFQMESEAAWHGIGHKLVPKEIWNPLLDSPGMRTLTVEGKRQDGREGLILVTVQPSAQLVHGVYIQVNDQYQLVKNGTPESAANTMRLMEEMWRGSLDRANKIGQAIIAQ